MKKQISMVMLLVIIGAVLLSGCMNQSDNGDKTEPIEDKVDPVSGGVPVAGGAGIVTEDKVSDDTSGEVGYIGKEYPVNNIPNTLVFEHCEGSSKYLDNFKLLNLRCEDGKTKLCVKGLKKTQDVSVQIRINGEYGSAFRVENNGCYEAVIHPHCYNDSRMQASDLRTISVTVGR